MGAKLELLVSATKNLTLVAPIIVLLVLAAEIKLELMVLLCVLALQNIFFYNSQLALDAAPIIYYNSINSNERLIKCHTLLKQTTHTQITQFLTC